MATVHTTTDDILTDDELSDTKEAFDLFDTSRRGSVDMHAFDVALKAMGFELTSEEATNYVLRVTETNGTDYDGRVNFPTFLEIIKQLTAKRDPVQHLLKSFNLFDSDGTGKISTRNIETVAKKLGETLSQSEIEAMVDEFDRDQDGYIDRKEFLYIMQQLH
jgi:centrin-3